MAAKFLDKLFKVEEKQIKALSKKADLVEAYADEIGALTNDELKAKTVYFRKLLSEGKTLDDILPEAFAVAREAAKRVNNEYPYHVQIMGAIALHQGDVAEMRTGEGKTLTAIMCVYLNALLGKGVHVITVNEYLAKRDAEWMGAIYRFLGLTVGCNARELNAQQKRAAYEPRRAGAGSDRLLRGSEAVCGHRVRTDHYLYIGQRQLGAARYHAAQQLRRHRQWRQTQRNGRAGQRQGYCTAYGLRNAAARRYFDRDRHLLLAQVLGSGRREVQRSRRGGYPQVHEVLRLDRLLLWRLRPRYL